MASAASSPLIVKTNRQPLSSGTFDTVDARYILQSVIGLRDLTEDELLVADITLDGKINSADVRAILKEIVEAQPL